VLGPLDVDHDFALVAIISRLPVRNYPLSLTVAPSRCVAGLIEVCKDSLVQSLLIFSFYGFASDMQATGDLLRQVLEAAVRFGAPFVILGDFNAETHDEVIAQFLAQGAVFDLDDDFTAYGLPLGSPGRVCRLDYGLAGARVYASQLDHAPGPADRLTVRYGFDFHQVGGHSGPRRKLLSMSKVVEQSAFDSLWSQEAFDHALTTGQFDEAWKLLSIAAETLLGESPAENSVPRSDS
jgi:endonuclease/exonuclease/phosphatase family metal-dependent hydrolase